MVTPIIKVSDETFRRLQELAVPLVDTTEDVIRRLLDDGVTSAGTAGRTALKQDRPASGKRERTVHVLDRAGLIKPGTKIVIHEPNLYGPLPTSINDRRWHARFGSRTTARENILWPYDSHEYSLSGLTEHLRDEFDVPVSSGGVNGYWCWALEEDPTISLAELADRYR